MNGVTMSQNKIVAIVPMRHSSERVKGKNYRPFGDGRPLYHHVVRNLEDCSLVTHVVIDTDSDFIRQDAAKYFPNVTVLERPPSLRDGGTAMNDVLLHTTGQLEADFFLQTHSTNPLLGLDTIKGAIQTFLDNYPMYDSLFSVTRWQTRLYDELGRAINHNPSILLRTQDLPPIYEENSCLYLFSRETLEQQHNRIGQRPYLFEIDPIESTDIDEEYQFRIAELLYKEMKGTV